MPSDDTKMTAIDTSNKHPKQKFGMYHERLSDRPRLMKHVLVCHASHVPVDNQFKTRKAKPKILVENQSQSQGQAVVNQTLHSRETQRRMLEKRFMEKFEGIKDEPNELKFPVLRASQPGGRVFKTHQLGVVARTMFMVRDPFNLKDPNSPAPAYSCYYDKHLQHFFMKPHLVKKLVSKGVIAEDGFIIEPYKIFKSYVEKKKAPFGRPLCRSVSPLSSAPSTPRVVEKPNPAASRTLADDQIKNYLSESYNLEGDLVAQLYSGVSGRRRASNTAPMKPMSEQNTGEDSARGEGSPLPPLRCNTPMRLATLETELQQHLHNSRMKNVLETREKLMLNRKATVIEQRFIKDKRLGDNKKQIKLDKEASRMARLDYLFNNKKDSTTRKREEIEKQTIETCIKKERNTKELKEKFASAFIKGKLHETEIKADRVKKEIKAKERNAKWLADQKEAREKYLEGQKKIMYERQMNKLAEITMNKSGKIAQLQMKCEYYEKNIDETLDTNNMLQGRLAGLQKLQKASDPNKLDSLKHY